MAALSVASRALRVTVVQPLLDPPAAPLVLEPPERLEPPEQPRSIADGEIPRLERRGRSRAVLVEADGRRRLVSFGRGVPGSGRVELVVDGWRVDVAVEPERRAGLRELATRGRSAARTGGTTEVRAMIPGRVVSVAVVPGQVVHAGQQLLVVEAMKMQNEVRGSRDGTVMAVIVEPGTTIEIGDPLVVIG